MSQRLPDTDIKMAGPVTLDTFFNIFVVADVGYFVAVVLKYIEEVTQITILFSPSKSSVRH